MANKEKPYINRNICAGCSLCVENCPAGCLSIESPEFRGDINTIAVLDDPDKCIGCKLCAKACPVDAISFGDAAFAPKRKVGLKMLLYKAFCRIYQGIFKIGMYVIPWRMPKTLEGPGCITKLPDMIKEQGYSKILVVTDPMLNEMGLLNKLYAAMDNSGIEYTVYDGVKPNPTNINVEEGLKLFRENNCEAIIAFGGGSPIDCAKGIGARHVKPNKTIEQLQGIFKVLHRIPTIFAVPTTAGTGSETTAAAVITNTENSHKASINDISLMPRFAVFDPELTAGLPPKVTSTTGMDALCHAVEAYTNHTYNSKLENELCKKAVKLIYENIYKAYCDGSDLEVRMNMQKAAFYAGRAFTRGCVGYVHALGHTLGGLYGTPHGLAMTVILPHVLRRYGSAAHKHLAELADVCGMNGANDAEKAEAFISWIEEMKEKMDIPVGFDVIKKEDIPQIIKWALKEANPFYPVPVIWDTEDLAQLIDAIRVKA